MAPRTRGMLSHKDGRAIPVSYAGVRIVVDGVPQGIVMSFCDDSSRRRLEGEVRELRAEFVESERRSR